MRKLLAAGAASLLAAACSADYVYLIKAPEPVENYPAGKKGKSLFIELVEFKEDKI